jgi:hypothetical protein
VRRGRTKWLLLLENHNTPRHLTWHDTGLTDTPENIKKQLEQHHLVYQHGV